MINPINFNQIHINDKFWTKKLNKWKQVLIRTCLDKCYESGRIDNFKKAGGLMAGDFKGLYYDDSDVYKVLEGAAYFLQLEEDNSLEEEIDQIISYIAAAQEEDGYLDTYYTLVEPEHKWTDMEKHEMYNGGHLIEAAVAYYQATGKNSLLNVAEKMVHHYISVFGNGKRDWVEGHEEIELALVKLYQITKKAEYLDFAKWLLSERGKGLGKGAIWNKKDWGPQYCQDDVPVEEIRYAVGHAVRAGYLYTAMAEVYKSTKDVKYLTALEAVWHDLAETKMYLTGGVGSSRENEGFKEPYFLPNESAYCETCAAIANVFFNHQMSMITGEAKYADVIERSIYNGILSGISQEGKQFFYVNPLSSIGNHHRSEWFDTSCCPTNLARFLPSIGNYIYSEKEDTLVVNQYIGSSFVKDDAKILIESELPWNGHVVVKIEGASPYKKLALRKPEWAKSWTLTKDAATIFPDLDDCGYLNIILDENSTNTEVVFDIDVPVRKTYCNEKVLNNRGKAAIEKGPLVYCAEQMDNKNLYYDELVLASDANYNFVWDETLDCNVLHVLQQQPLNLIPYYAWDNREPGYMKVWLDQDKKDTLYHNS